MRVRDAASPSGEEQEVEGTTGAAAFTIVRAKVEEKQS